MTGVGLYKKLNLSRSRSRSRLDLDVLWINPAFTIHIDLDVYIDLSSYSLLVFRCPVFPVHFYDNVVDDRGNTAVLPSLLDVNKSRHKWPDCYCLLKITRNKFNILYGNASTEENALRFLQDNNLIRSVPLFQFAVKIWPLYCIRHGHTINIKPGSQHCDIIMIDPPFSPFFFQWILGAYFFFRDLRVMELLAHYHSQYHLACEAEVYWSLPDFVC